MKVLESCQVLWRVGGVCLSASATTKDVYISVLANVLICGNMVSFFAMVFAYAMVIDDVKRFFYAILQFLVLFNIIATYLSVIFVKRDIGQMVDSLQQLIDDRLKYRRQHTMYDVAERRAHFLTKKGTLSNTIIYCVAFTVYSSVSIARHFRNHRPFDVTEWYCTKTPYDSTNLGGYLVFYAHAMTLKVTYFVTFFCILTVFLCMCMYMEAMCVDFKQTFVEIDQMALDEPHNSIKLKRTLIATIDFHGQIHMIFKQLSTASSGILFVQQVFGAIQIAAGIFQLDVAVREFDARMINVPLLTLLIICTLLTYCYFASRITAKLNQNINIIYTSKWYLLPLEQQRYIVHMICFAQRNHILYGLNMLPCSLDSFVMIMKASASYYLMMKQF